MRQSVIIFLLTLLLPLGSSARFGWSFTDYSLLAGQLYGINKRPIWSIDLQYDRYTKNCLIHKYFGWGVIYSFNDTYQEIGLKGMWNPITITRKFYPYLFTQGNYPMIKTSNNVSSEISDENDFSLRPGIGLTGNFKENKVWSIRTYFQTGYTIPFQDAESQKGSFMFEFKVGIGCDLKQLKQVRESRKKNKPTEAG